jgi:hypothetical protein
MWAERRVGRQLCGTSASRGLQAGGAEVCAAEVSFHEICLAIGWYLQSLDPETRSAPPDQELPRLKGILGRAIKQS